MKRRDFFSSVGLGGMAMLSGLPALSYSPVLSSPQEDHAFFAGLLEKIAAPVLALMARERLHRDFPLEVSSNSDGRDQRVVYLECFGRTMAGTAPWLALTEPGPDQSTRETLRDYAIAAYENSVNPKSADYLDWNLGQGQMLVDSAFYTQALIRAPILWQKQSTKTKKNIVKAIKSLRKITPPYTN